MVVLVLKNHQASINKMMDSMEHQKIRMNKFLIKIFPSLEERLFLSKRTM